MEDIIKIVKSLEDSGLLLKGVTETIQNKAKEQKGEFLSKLFNNQLCTNLLGTLGASLLGNILTGKGIDRAGYDSKDLQCKRGKGVVRAGYVSKFDF